MNRLTVLLLLLFLPCLVAAQGFSSLEERMSAADFHAAGLDKLSEEELARLNEWLRTNVSAGSAAAAAVQDDRIGFPAPQPTGVVVSRIDGEFTGWDGDTVFRLQNGQVWEQTDTAGRLSAPSTDSPGVRIEPGMFGAWVLRVDGYNSRVQVKRIK